MISGTDFICAKMPVLKERSIALKVFPEHRLQETPKNAQFLRGMEKKLVRIVLLDLTGFD